MKRCRRIKCLRHENHNEAVAAAGYRLLGGDTFAPAAGIIFVAFACGFHKAMAAARYGS